MKNKKFDTIAEALQFQDSLIKDKIKSNLTHKILDENYKVEWLVSWK